MSRYDKWHVVEAVRKPQMLMIYVDPSAFVLEDIRILRKKYDIEVFHFDLSGFKGGFKGFFQYLGMFWRQLVWLMRELQDAHIVYGWFADFHMLLPVLISKVAGVPVAISLGGYDCMKMQSLNYGVFSTKSRARSASIVYKNASLLLPVTGRLAQADSISKNWQESYPNGFLVNLPGLRTEWKTMHTGFDPKRWIPGEVERKRRVLSVAIVNNERTFLRKGMDLLIEAAKLLPDVEFYLTDIHPEVERIVREKYKPTENVRMFPPGEQDSLLEQYQASSVYAQVSRAEGLPSTLCEAMFCGCIPVGSAVFGIPQAIGECGIIVPIPEPKMIARAIRQALEMDSSMREKVRSRMLEHFTLKRREENLVSELEKLALKYG